MCTFTFCLEGNEITPPLPIVTTAPVLLFKSLWTAKLSSSCIFLDLLIPDYPQVLPLSSSRSFLLTDQYQFGQKHLRCLVSWYRIVVCFGHCCLMTHSWTGSFIFCYVFSPSASICTNSFFDPSTSFLHQKHELSIACFLSVSDILSTLMEWITTLLCICLELFLSLIHQTSWSQPSNYKFRWMCSWHDKSSWPNLLHCP